MIPSGAFDLNLKNKPDFFKFGPCGLGLTNRFHFAVRLFSYRSQMTSKCGKNKKVAHEPLGEWVTDVLTTF